jgi:hypothetical protein
MHKPQTPIILTVTEVAWMACGLIAGLGLVYYFSWWAGVLNYAETIITFIVPALNNDFFAYLTP